MSESDAVHDIVALVVHQFQFDMFLFASYDLARSVVIYMLRTKQRFRIVRPERIELFKVVVKLVRDVFEVYCASMFNMAEVCSGRICVST